MGLGTGQRVEESLSSNDGENILENGEMKVGIVCISLEQ